MLTWGVVFAIAVGVYGQRVIGMMALDPARLGPRAQSVLSHIPIAILSAVIGLQTFSRGGALELDARVWGVGAAIVCASRKLPMFVTVLIGAIATALARAIT